MKFPRPDRFPAEAAQTPLPAMQKSGSEPLGLPNVFVDSAESFIHHSQICPACTNLVIKQAYTPLFRRLFLSNFPAPIRACFQTFDEYKPQSRENTAFPI